MRKGGGSKTNKTTTTNNPYTQAQNANTPTSSPHGESRPLSRQCLDASGEGTGEKKRAPFERGKRREHCISLVISPSGAIDFLSPPPLLYNQIEHIVF